MITPYCPQGHANPPGSRFCLHCGEKLDLPMSNGIEPGVILGDRYAVICLLAQGGFGRTYLAQDTNRFNELCVLKEFAPQAESAEVLQKAEELFEREAGVLYKLQHPQIPRFRELFRVNLVGEAYLFLVQDYVEGETYRTLLDARIGQGKRFSEAEVTHFLLEILPVLDYIHSMRVIHRDISPENLILRNFDQLPVLIDFGGVKQVTVTVITQFNQRANNKATATATLLGKVGYAPPEQMQTGSVYPHSDLYALAATVLVLLTGKEPQALIDSRSLTWKWQQEVNVSPMLRMVLEKMLSHRMGDRYQSAQEVFQVLNPNAATGVSTPHTQVTVAIAPPHHALTANPPAAIVASKPFIRKLSNSLFSLGKILLALPLVIVAAGAGWWAVSHWLEFQDSKRTPATSKSPPTVTPQFSAAEQNRKQQLRDRRQQLGINNQFFIAAVDQAFWEKHPHLRGRNLSATAEDAALRTEWDDLAAQLLNQLQTLSPQLRRRLGSYTAKDRTRWRRELIQLNLSSRALYDLTDAAFFEQFPQQRGKNFMNQPISQVWSALAAERLQAILVGTAYEKIVLDADSTSKQVNGNLKPGEGKAYVAELVKEQSLKLDLQANPQVLISVYTPSGKKILLEDSSDRTWQGTLSESGFYEFVIVSTASNPTNYQLNLTTENSSTNSPAQSLDERG